MQDPRSGSEEWEALRTRIAANSGLRGLEILDPTEIDRALRLFDRDGFVVVRDALDAEQLDRLRHGVAQAVDEIVALDPDRRGNRGSHRYSFGGSSITRSMLHRPEWQMLIDLPTIAPILTAIFGSDDSEQAEALAALEARLDVYRTADGCRIPFSSLLMTVEVA